MNEAGFFFFFLKGAIVGPNKCIVCFKVWKLRGMWAGWQHDGYLCCSCFECNLPPGSAGSVRVRVVPVAHCGEINEIPKIHSTQRKWPELTWPKLVRSTGAGSDYLRTQQTGPDGTKLSRVAHCCLSSIRLSFIIGTDLTDLVSRCSGGVLQKKSLFV